MAWPTLWPQGRVKGTAELETEVAIGLAHRRGYPPRRDRSHPHPKGHDRPLPTAGQGCRRASGARRLQLWSPKSPSDTEHTVHDQTPHRKHTRQPEKTRLAGEDSAAPGAPGRRDAWRRSPTDPSKAIGRRGRGSVSTRRQRGAHRALPKS